MYFAVLSFDFSINGAYDRFSGNDDLLPSVENINPESVAIFKETSNTALENSRSGRHDKKHRSHLKLISEVKIDGIEHSFMLVKQKIAKDGGNVSNPNFRGGCDLKSFVHNPANPYKPKNMNIRLTNYSVTFMGWESAASARSAMMQLGALLLYSSTELDGMTENVRMHKTHFWIRPNQNLSIDLYGLAEVMEATKIATAIGVKSKKNVMRLSAKKSIPGQEDGSITIHTKGFVQLCTFSEDASKALYATSVPMVIDFLDRPHM